MKHNYGNEKHPPAFFRRKANRRIRRQVRLELKREAAAAKT